MRQKAAVSKAAFGRAVGISRQRVDQLIKNGLPVRPDGKVDLAAGSAWVKKNVATREPGAAGNLVAGRLRKVDLETELLRLDLAKRQGELIELADAERAWGGMITRARSRFLSIPAGLSPEIAMERDP